MKRWLSEFRVESDIKLEDDLAEFVFRQSAAEFEVIIKNSPEDSSSTEVLSVYIIFAADTIQSAEDLAKVQINKILHLLSFITNTGYRLTRMICLVDWSIGIIMRDMYVYTRHADDEPEPAINNSLLPTISTFFGASPNPLHDRAMRWFAAGVRARIMEDQFQYFWFVIELIANSIKGSGKITDQCQKCKGDLYCSSCGEKSEHKPFPKQAISALLSKIGVHEKLIKDLFSVRNALMHGHTREMIEEMLHSRDTNASLALVTDHLGKMAWTCILNHYQLKESPVELTFFHAGGYVKTTISAHIHIQTVVPGELKIENITLPQVKLT